MGAVVQENGNNAQKTGRRRFPPGKIRKGPHRIFNGNPPPSLLSMPNMRPRMPPPGRMMPPRMRLMGPPAPGMRPPPPFRGGPLHPPHNMMRGPGPRGPPPLGMRPPPPGMRPPPPGMRPPPPHMRPPMPPPLMGPQRGPRRGFRSGPPPLLPPDKMRRMQHGKIIKKKKQMYNDNDLSKPWVTENVKLEYTKKEELLKAAKSSKQPTDWATYREQRDKCSKMYAAAKMEYIGQHPEEAYKMEEDSLSEEEGDDGSEYIQENYSGMNQQSSSAGFICDTCEREFQTYWQHQKHMGEHRTCGIDGCTFTAHEKIIEKHIRMQHSSGLYDKIRNLVTPEDISKWIEERKKKYPKKENVEKRYKQQEEMLKRGEKLQRNSSRFDKNNRARFSLNRQNQSQQKTFKKRAPSKRKIAQQQQQKKPISLIDDKSDWNGTLFPFKGTSQLYDKEPVEIINNFDDTEWLEETPPATPTKIVLKNALGALMSAYDSGDDSETENLPKNEDKPKVELHKENIPKLENIQTVKIEVPIITTPSDDEAPTEQKIERLDTLSETASAPTPSDNKRGRKRKRVHKKGSHKQQKQGFNDNSNNDKSKSMYKKRRVTLLERLLASEITHERNMLLQCVRYVVTNGFFDIEISDDKSKIIGENLCIPDDKTTEASVI